MKKAFWLLVRKALLSSLVALSMLYLLDSEYTIAICYFILIWPVYEITKEWTRL